MATVVVLIFAALLLGGLGLAVEALRWVLFIALALVVLSVVAGRRGRR